MVKNTHGGSGHKKFGRKYTTSKHSNRLRISENEYEIYAIATKMLGNNMIYCHCIDGILRLGHIRGKFTGRGKRDNMIGLGTWLLIGVRTWDEPIGKDTDSKELDTKKKSKLQQCDILEVYSDFDKQNLKDTIDDQWIELENNDVSRSVIADKMNSEVSDDIRFATEKDMEREYLMDEMKSSTVERISLKLEETSQEEEDKNLDEEVDFNDI